MTAGELRRYLEKLPDATPVTIKVASKRPTGTAFIKKSALQVYHLGEGEDLEVYILTCNLPMGKRSFVTH